MPPEDDNVVDDPAQTDGDAGRIDVAGVEIALICNVVFTHVVVLQGPSALT